MSSSKYHHRYNYLKKKENKKLSNIANEIYGYCGCDECTQKCYRKFKLLKKYVKDKNKVNIFDYSYKCIKYAPKKKKLEYNVYLSSLTTDEIYVFNIFENRKFMNMLYETKKKYQDDPEKFLDSVLSDLRYCFWSKFEYETYISGLSDYTFEKGAKLDACEQVLMNWNVFKHYLLDNIDLIKKSKK